MILFSWQHAIRAEETLEPLTKYVLLMLATHMAPDGTGCFPSVRRQAKETGLSVSAVCNHLNEAEKAGWVVRSRRSGEATNYRASWPSKVLREEEHLDTERREEDSNIPKTLSLGSPCKHTESQRGKESVVLGRAVQGRELQREFVEVFWPAYPHKVAKPVALKSFIKARGLADMQTIMRGLEAYKAGKPIDRAWCNPTTWLNQERWADQPAIDVSRETNGHHKRSFNDAVDDFVADVEQRVNGDGGKPRQQFDFDLEAVEINAARKPD